MRWNSHICGPSIGFILKIPPLVAGGCETRGGIFNNRTKSRKFFAPAARFGKNQYEYPDYTLFGPPAGLLPPEAEIFEVFECFLSDFTVKNEHFLKGFVSQTTKNFSDLMGPVVAKQGGGIFNKGGGGFLI